MAKDLLPIGMHLDRGNSPEVSPLIAIQFRRAIDHFDDAMSTRVTILQKWRNRSSLLHFLVYK